MTTINISMIRVQTWPHAHAIKITLNKKKTNKIYVKMNEPPNEYNMNRDMHVKIKRTNKECNNKTIFF